MTTIARVFGWYEHWTNRLGQAAIRRMFPDDADEQDLDESLRRNRGR